MAFPEILTWVQYGNKSGTLILQRRAISKKLCLQHGKIIAVSSTDSRELFGQVLISLGMVSEEQLKMAFKKQAETKRLLGRVLIEDCGVIEEMISEAIRYRGEEALYDVYLWNEGVFRFMNRVEPVADYERLFPPIAIEPLLLEGARRIDTWKRLRGIFPSRYCVIHKSDKMPEKGLERTNRVLSRVINHLDKPRSIEQLVLENHAPAFLVYEALGILYDAGVIRVAEAAQEEPEVEVKPRDQDDSGAIEEIFRQAQSAYKQGDDAKAIGMLEDLLMIEENPEARALLEKAKVESRKKVQESIPMDAILEVNDTLTDLESHLRSNHEAFVLSRINGQWDVKSIITILPLTEYESMKILNALLDRNVIRVAKKGGG